MEQMFSKEEIEIFNKYPELFRQTKLSAQESCMHWGLDCPKEWYPQIELMCKELTENSFEKFIEFAQIKSKFWKFRCYVDFLTNDDEIKNKIFKVIEKHADIIDNISIQRNNLSILSSAK